MEFDRRVWEWRAQYGRTIVDQFQRLGASCDYVDERFTLDERYVAAVMKVFVDLYDKGLIYRDNYMVNWDPGTRSAISDLEVEDREVTDTLYYIDYPLEDGSGVVTVATVRPETMLADTAVAVNPEDERYTHLVGKHATSAAGRPPPADHRRRVREAGVRHRRAQDHPGARPQRLRDRPPSQPAGGQRDRRGRAHDRGRRPLRRPHGRGGAQGGGRGARAGGPDPQAGALHAHGAVLTPLRRAHRAADLAPVVHAHARAGRARERGGAHGPGPLPPRALGAGLPRLARQHPAVVHLAAAVVGAPAAGLVLRRVRRDVRRRAAARALRRLRRRAAPRRRRARHVVLVRAVAVRDARVARRHAGAARVLPDGRARHRARHHLPVGRADGDDGPRVHARRPVHGRGHHLDHPGARRPPHVEVARDRHRPARRDRGARRGRGPVRPARHVLVAGRALLGGEDPAGPAAREQDVERLAAGAAERGRCRARAAAARRRGPLDPVAAAARDPALARPGRGLRHVTRCAGPVHVLLRRLLRLVPGDGQAAPVRAGGGGVGHAAARARPDPRARPSDAAVRHRGDPLVPARRRRETSRSAPSRSRTTPCWTRRRSARSRP